MTQPTRSALLAASAVLMLCFLSDPPAKAQNPPLQCTTSVTVTPTLRSEGYNEQTSDMVLNCTGGTPTPAGQPIPQANITVFFNAPVTSRPNNPLTGQSEALLLIDEPGAPGSSSFPQVLCTSPDGCTVLGNGTGVGTFNGTAGRPNIFQARVTGNSVEWDGVPIDPPGVNGKRVFRITNVRANATGLAVGSQIIANSVFSGNSALPVLNFTQPVGTVQPGLKSSVLNQQTVPGCVPTNNTFLLTNPPPADNPVILSFSENFPTAFKTRVSSPSVPQNVPGTIYNSESNFILPPSAGGPQSAGLADFGTRLKATFSNVPAGVRLFVSTTNVSSLGAPMTPSSPFFAQMTGSESGIFSAIPQLGTSGAGEVPLVNGSGTAVWEVVNTNPAALDNFNFGVWFSYQPPPNLTGTLPTGTASVNMLFAPSPPVSGVFDPGLSIPRFTDGPAAGPFALTTFSTCGGAPTALTTNVNSFNFFSPSVNSTAPTPFNFFVFNNTVQTQTGIGGGGGGNFYPIAPGGFGTDGYSKQDFSYQVTPTATTDQKWLQVSSGNGGSPATFTVTADPTGLAPGKYSGNVSISALGQNSLTSTITATIPATLTIAPPGPLAPTAGFVSATTYQGSFAVPGMPLVIFGSRFGASSLTGLSLTPDNTAITSSIANTRVLFDGTPAPMIYSANGQISTIVPFELAGKTSTQAVIEQNGVQSPAVSLPVLDAAPGLFTANSAGTGPGAILNANSDGTTSFNSPSNPAPAGSIVVLYASGAGQTKPPGKTGHLAIDQVLPAPVLPVTVFLDGVQAEVLYAGSAPGLFEGVLQVNVKIPASVKPGNRVVVVKVGSTQTPPWATVAVSAAQ